MGGERLTRHMYTRIFSSIGGFSRLLEERYLAMTDPHPAHSRRLLGGCPAYVKGWCCKAGDRTLQRGYRDVGYLLAARLRAFRPERVTPRRWAWMLGRLRRLLKAADDTAAVEWFADAYPHLMALIPVGDHRDFVAGVRERRG